MSSIEPDRGLAARQSDEGTKPQCGSSSRGRSYNTPLHVFALILILALSTLGKVA